MKMDFAVDKDGWIEVARAGQWQATVDDLEVVQVVTAETLTRLAGSPLPCLVDADHESESDAKRTEALGWIEEWKVDGDRLLGRVRWTALGEPMVLGGVYRFTSPVWLYESRMTGTVSPVSMVSVGLTNRPNIPGMKPISNGKQGKDGSDVILLENNNNERKMKMENILKALGLTEGDEAAVVAEIEALVAAKTA